MPGENEGAVLWRGDDGYEAARRAAVWNGRKPNRFPEVIVRPRTDDEVIAAVRLARTRGLKIGVRSGGHSWAASFLRDGGMLIDLSRMTAFSVDAAARAAAIQPGLKGTDLNRALRKHGLFFPSGHCTSVGLGGFLLQGGFGWNSRQWGPACVSVRAIDVVTADGERVHADAHQNADLFWAARGSGPGFFGIVTRFHLALYPRPSDIMKSDYVYPIEALDDVLGWTRATLPDFSRVLEPMVFVRRDILGHPGPGLLVTSPAFADSRDEAMAALAQLESCPVLQRAVMRAPYVDTEFDDLLQGGDDLFYPQGAHYAADNMWTHAPAEALLPGMHRIVATLPPAPSHMMWMHWGPVQDLPDMAFSMQDDLYVALYAVWDDDTQNASHQAWVTDNMRALEPQASGIQLADENLGARPFRFLAESNLQRLDALRAKHDPDGLFFSYMGRPD